MNSISYFNIRIWNHKIAYNIHQRIVSGDESPLGGIHQHVSVVRPYLEPVVHPAEHNGADRPHQAGLSAVLFAPLSPRSTASPPEMRIPTGKELAERFGIGRSSIREAIKIFNSPGVLRQGRTGDFCPGTTQHFQRSSHPGNAAGARLNCRTLSTCGA